MYNIDLHTHSLLSDGALLPSEAAVRYLHQGYETIAITDHADYSNIGPLVKSILEFAKNWPKDAKIKVLPGIELTHLPLQQFKPLAEYARKQGIKIIIAHGETPAEPVIKGTNRAALQADIDILAHPGFISEADVKLAKQKGIFLEVTSRHGHCDTNSYVIEHAQKIGAKLILNNDSHAPQDIITPQELARVAHFWGLDQKNIDQIYQKVNKFLKDKEGK